VLLSIDDLLLLGTIEMHEHTFVQICYKQTCIFLRAKIFTEGKSLAIMNVRSSPLWIFNFVRTNSSSHRQRQTIGAFLVQQSSIGEICTFFVFFSASLIFNSIGLRAPSIHAKQ
jgi:hypothetical protein